MKSKIPYHNAGAQHYTKVRFVSFLSYGFTSKLLLHYVLRVLKTFLWDPRCQTYIFKTKIT